MQLRVAISAVVVALWLAGCADPHANPDVSGRDKLGQAKPWQHATFSLVDGEIQAPGAGIHQPGGNNCVVIPSGTQFGAFNATLSWTANSPLTNSLRLVVGVAKANETSVQGTSPLHVSLRNVTTGAYAGDDAVVAMMPVENSASVNQTGILDLSFWLVDGGQPDIRLASCGLG